MIWYSPRLDRGVCRLSLVVKEAKARPGNSDPAMVRLCYRPFRFGWPNGRCLFAIERGRTARPSVSTRFQSTVNEEPKRPKKERSRHATWYREVLPDMVPVMLVGFAVYGVRPTPMTVSSARV